MGMNTIDSVRGLSRELERLDPITYNSSTLFGILAYTQRNGSKFIKIKLLQDLLMVLRVKAEDIFKFPVHKVSARSSKVLEDEIPSNKLKLNLTESIAISDRIRTYKGLDPLRSVRNVARELENRWPHKYKQSYIHSRLYRSDKNGILFAPNDLIRDLLCILMVEEKDLVINPVKLKGTVSILTQECNTLRTSTKTRLTLI